MKRYTGAERKQLRGLAHNLTPIVQIGKNGLTDGAIHSIDFALESHELIKVKFAEFKDQKKQLSESISEKTFCEWVGMIGNISIFYREQSDPNKQKVILAKK
jgi:RNA-binding protein